MNKYKNRLAKENCNKSHCKTCIFHPNESKRIQLSEERILEIKTYLATFKSSHICHQTNKTCYGALEFQSRILGMNVGQFLETAKNVLNL